MGPIIIAIAAITIGVLLCIGHFRKKHHSRKRRRTKGSKEALLSITQEKAVDKHTKESDTPSTAAAIKELPAEHTLPDGKFDKDGLLGFCDGFYRKDVPFLSDEEFSRYLESGEEAVKTFTQGARSAWSRWSKDRESIRDRSYKYRKQYIKDLTELTNELNKRHNTGNKQIDFHFWQDEWKVNVWKSHLGPGALANTGIKECWLLQCYLLQKVKRIPLAFENDQLLQDSAKFLGTELDELYPIITCPDHIEAIRTLVYDFGYGPNAFPWHLKSAEQDYLKERPTKLYLISIDLGSLTGQAKCLVWKIGITSRPQVKGRGNARYTGKYAKHIEVLREVEYQDGSIAFMKEQVYIQLASREKSRSLGKRIDGGKLSERDRSTLGLSEIVLEGRAKKLAISLFDQITL